MGDDAGGEEVRAIADPYQTMPTSPQRQTPTQAQAVFPAEVAPYMVMFLAPVHEEATPELRDQAAWLASKLGPCIGLGGPQDYGRSPGSRGSVPTSAPRTPLAAVSATQLISPAVRSLSAAATALA